MTDYIKHKFKEGEDVAHKENISQKLTVSRILKESISYPSGETDTQGNEIKKLGTRMIWIECHWWVDGKLMIHQFHSRELVPFEIASQGKDAVIEWIEKTK